MGTEPTHRHTARTPQADADASRPAVPTIPWLDSVTAVGVVDIVQSRAPSPTASTGCWPTMISPAT
jgi:hypothetical protein